MLRYCVMCKELMPEEAVFCPKCSAAPAPQTSAAPTVPNTYAPTSAPQLAESFASGTQDVELRRSVFSGRTMWLGIGAVLLAIVIAYYVIFIRDDVSDAGGKPTYNAAPAAKPEVKAATYYALVKANIRDKPSAADSNIVGSVPRGEQALGNMKAAEGEDNNWLELADGRGFISAVNLSESAPPQIITPLNDKIWKADAATDIWSAPVDGTLVDRASAGTPLMLAGLVTGDMIEIKLRKGGVGYIAGGARIIALLQTPAAEPITLSFRPDNCDFGGGIGAAFTQLSRQQDARRAAIDKQAYADPDARQTALEAYDAKVEGRSAYTKLNREYKGLIVSGIGMHYESQSIYFDEPPAKVIAAFKQAGYKIGNDGAFQTSELYASIGATGKSDSIHGKSELSCGV